MKQLKLFERERKPFDLGPPLRSECVVIAPLPGGSVVTRYVTLPEGVRLLFATKPGMFAK